MLCLIEPFFRLPSKNLLKSLKNMDKAQYLWMTPGSPPTTWSAAELYQTGLSRGDVAGSIGMVSAIVFVSLRSYAKIWVLRSVGWDDSELFAYESPACI